ncbi:MAG: hypothetical protein ACXADX_17155 [Candidatus Hodarchaeales archaeon]|jgi:hypothetical protein
MKTKIVFLALGVLVSLMAFNLVAADAKASGAAKIQMLDHTQNGIQDDDPVIGFVILNQNGEGSLIITVSLKGAVANAILEVSFVTSGTNPDGGIGMWGHYGAINVLGTISTNGQGNGNAHFIIDAADISSLAGTWPGVTNYAHIDIEDDSGAITPGIMDYGLVGNQYGGTPLQWEQP